MAAQPAPASPGDTIAIAGAHLTARRLAVTLGALSLILLATIVLSIAFGAVHISLATALTVPQSPDRAILIDARLPRVLMAAIVGAILAAVGAALQALVRNPLAEGGILGISGGGAFGAILALVFCSQLAWGDTLVPLAAFAMALLSTAAVYRLAMVRGRLEPLTLLLVGVIFNAFWGAAIMLVNSVVNFYFTHSILFWLMGSFEAPSWRGIQLTGAIAIAGFVLLMLCARDMNLMSLGDDDAAELGLDVDRLRRLLFIVTSILIGAAVAVSGVITFVGLIVPHVLRRLSGADHRLLIPASILGGAAFTVIADLIARSVIAPSELPVGAITALCGGPFFIYALRRSNNPLGI